MRILHVAGLRRWGGIATLVRELATYQREQQGIDVGVLSLLTDSTEQEADLRGCGVPVHDGALEGGYDVRPQRYHKLLRLMRSFDILHFHEFHPVVAACAALSGARIVHTEHGTFQRAHQAKDASAFLKKRVLGIPFLTHRTDAVVFVSSWLRQDVALKTASTHVIHNGTTAKGVRGPHKTGDTFRILTSGRFEPRKRFDRLIRAFRATSGHDRMLLQILGDGTLAPQLYDLARKCLPETTYRFYGYQHEVAPFYSDADLFVLPAEREPFGLVVVEAMFAGIPVICFRDSGGATEIVADIHEHLLVADENELSNAIAFWRDHPDLRQSVGAALQERANREFSVGRMADEYQTLYHRILAGATPAQRRVSANAVSVR